VWNCCSQEMLGDTSLYLRAWFIDPRRQVTCCSSWPLNTERPSALSRKKVYSWNWQTRPHS